MFLATIPPSAVNALKIILPHDGLEADPRVICEEEELSFKCSIEKNILIVTRNDNEDGDEGYQGWFDTCYIRIYDPSVEEVPDFTSDTYSYQGLDHESAPVDAIEVTVDPSVRTIKSCAFQGCKHMKKCTMSDNVERIEKRAFFGCLSLDDIRLSMTLRFIGEWAFGRCHSIDSLFLPNTIEDIERHAFHCSKMRLLVLPPDIDLARVDDNVIWGCDDLLLQYERDLLAVVDDPQGPRHEGVGGVGRDTKHHHIRLTQWMKYRYNHLPLFKLCTDLSITFRMIHDFIEEHGNVPAYQKEKFHGLTPLHVLILHPRATLDTVMACFYANPGASFTPDDVGCTPLKYLWEESNVKGIVSIITHLCIHATRIDGI